jgi:ABC-type multidrug transport system permease subunit
MFLFLWAFLLFASTFTDMIVAGIETAETAGNLSNLFFSLCLVFNGVLAPPSVLPRFWIFMYRVSPLTYLVDGMLSVGLANTRVQCSDVEYLHFNPPSGLTCSQYLEPYISTFGGSLSDASANSTSVCEFCTLSDTNDFLLSVSSSYENRWRNFGLMWVYIVFNVMAAIGLYWLARVPRKRKEKEGGENAGEKAVEDSTTTEEGRGK